MKPNQKKNKKTKAVRKRQLQTRGAKGRANNEGREKESLRCIISQNHDFIYLFIYF